MEKWPYVADVLWGPAVYSPLVTRAICSRGALYVGFMGPSVVAGTIVGALTGGAGPWPSWLPGLAARGCCWATAGQGQVLVWLDMEVRGAWGW